MVRVIPPNAGDGPFNGGGVVPPNDEVEWEENSFRGRLKRLRERYRFTLDEVAQKSGITKGYLWQLENEEKNPSACTVIKLAKLYNVTMEYLLEGECYFCGRQYRIEEPTK